MGHRRRVRMTGKATPSLDTHARFNATPENNPTWQRIVAERDAEQQARGIRYQRADTDDLDEAA